MGAGLSSAAVDTMPMLCGKLQVQAHDAANTCLELESIEELILRMMDPERAGISNTTTLSIPLCLYMFLRDTLLGLTIKTQRRCFQRSRSSIKASTTGASSLSTTLTLLRPPLCDVPAAHHSLARLVQASRCGARPLAIYMLSGAPASKCTCTAPTSMAWRPGLDS